MFKVGSRTLQRHEEPGGINDTHAPHGEVTKAGRSGVTELPTLVFLEPALVQWNHVGGIAVHGIGVFSIGINQHFQPIAWIKRVIVSSNKER